MSGILLTQNSTFIIGDVARILGWIMSVLFNFLDSVFGIQNIGLCIILFTAIIYLLMLPLTIKQQKFSKLSAKMNPEIQEIQKKYKNKKDNDSMMAMNEETQAVYAKYGVSPSGSCVQLLIQMPILFALYRVIYAMPAYVTKIGNTFRVLADKIISVDNGAFIQNSEVESIANTVAMYGKSLTEGTNVSNGIIDVLNKLSSTDLAAVAEHYDLNQLTYEGQLILNSDSTRGLIDTYNNFLGLNIADSPMSLIRGGWMEGLWGIVIGAALIPILSAVTQWINVKLMPQAPTNKENEQASSMAQSMKTMNMIMPIFSAWMCLSLPAGMGLYWVAGSVVRSIQQVIINRHIDKLDFEEIIKKNSAKSAKKMEKIKKQQEMMKEYSSINTRNIQSKASATPGNTNTSSNSQSSTSQSTSNAKPGSMMAKANMVRDYNERNNNSNK